MGDCNQPLMGCDLLNCQQYIFVLRFTIIQNYSEHDLDILCIYLFFIVGAFFSYPFFSSEYIASDVTMIGVEIIGNFVVHYCHVY
jgi:hypothetical protein